MTEKDRFMRIISDIQTNSLKNVAAATESSGPEISYDPSIASEQVAKFLDSYGELEIIRKSHNITASDTIDKEVFTSTTTEDTWYDVKCKGAFLFHIECVKFGGGFISTPLESSQYKPDRYSILNQDNWGFYTWPGTTKKLYNIRGSSYGAINHIVDYLM